MTRCWPHTTPLIWEHIGFSGDFLWERAAAASAGRSIYAACARRHDVAVRGKYDLNRVGGTPRSAPLPHHRAYGSVHGGS